MTDRFRDWPTYCPRRFDREGLEPAPLGNGTRRVAYPEVHVWRTEWQVADRNAAIRPAVDVAFEPMALPNGYYCARCLAHMTGDLQIDRYRGEPDEMQAMFDELTRRAAAGEAE